MLKKITLILFLIISTISFNLNVAAKNDTNLVNIYFFHSDTCSHCKEELKFLNTLEKRYSNIKIYKYEIHNEENLEILKKVEKIYADKFNSVPLTIIGNEPYTGFSEKNKIKFIKTIEYFSKYGYEDKIGKYLNIKLPTYEIDKNTIELDKFIDTYHNYNLLGFKTDNLETNNISLLLGILLSLNFISLLGIVLVLLVLSKLKEEILKIKSIILYILNITILLLKSLVDNNILTIIIFILLIIGVIYNIIKNNKYNRYLNIIIIISITINLILTYLTNKNILIFKNILNLNKLTGLNLVYYYCNCLIIYFIINFILIYIGYTMIKKIEIKSPINEN